MRLSTTSILCLATTLAATRAQAAGEAANGFSAEFRRDAPGKPVAFTLHYMKGHVRIDYPDGGGLTELWDYARRMQLGVMPPLAAGQPPRVVSRPYDALVSEFGGKQRAELAALDKEAAAVKDATVQEQKRSAVRFKKGLLDSQRPVATKLTAKVGSFDCAGWVWSLTLEKKGKGCFVDGDVAGGTKLFGFLADTEKFLAAAWKAGSTPEEMEAMFGPVLSFASVGLPARIETRQHGTLILSELRAARHEPAFFEPPSEAKPAP